MNIIKLKDKISDLDFFNESLKGKYAIAFNYKYVFPLGIENVTSNIDEIIFLERKQLNEMPDSEIHTDLRNGDSVEFYKNQDYIILDEWIGWFDPVDDLDKFLYLNEFTTDDAITLDELKRFRTWLAEVLYANQEWIKDWSKDPAKHNRMLQYYIQEMYDDVVQALTKFNTSIEINSITKQSGCGCQGGIYVNPSDTLSVCDPLLIYRHNIYKYMVEIFSDITYWLGQVEICSEMKKYIDNIIKVGLPLSSVTLYNNFADCTCRNADVNEQTTMTNILKRLSQALEYIITDQVSGNRNYISSALLDWSAYLYEKMRW